MEQIINAAALGTYITTGAALGKGTYKDANNQDVNYKFVKLDVRDQRAPNAQHRAMMLFCSSSDEIETLYEMLKEHIKHDETGNVLKDRSGCALVDWRDIRLNHKELYQELVDEGWTRWEGMRVENVPLQKGNCYRNDRQGNIMKDKYGNQITASSINILTMVNYIAMTENGPKTYYMAGWDPDSQRNQMEQRFYRNPCVQETAIHDELPPAQPATSAQIPPTAGTTTPPIPASANKENIDDEY